MKQNLVVRSAIKYLFLISNIMAVCGLAALCYVFCRGLFQGYYRWGFEWWDAGADLGLTALGLVWATYELGKRIWRAR